MDAFEQIIEGIFRQQGYWTQTSYKINLSPEEKRAIGKHSMPRPEIDILAYKPLKNELLWIECKSYLDSDGVRYTDFLPDGKHASRYKIFNDHNYRQIAAQRLLQQVTEQGRTLPNPSLRFCLVAGKSYSVNQDKIPQHFIEQGWEFYDANWIRAQLSSLAKLGYENDIAIMVAKLFAKE